jgi:drug/metabolite transporter (DMT)-like permease
MIQLILNCKKNNSLNQTKLAHLALLGTNIFFAINFTAVKFLINAGFVQPFALNIIRVGITAILLWALYFFKPQKISILQKDYGRLFLCALTGIAINQLLFIKGLSLTTSIHASLLMLTTPILITIIAAFILKERITSFKIIGLLLGIAGALVLILLRDSAVTNPKDILVGDILVIINAVSYTFYFVLIKPLMKIYPPIMVLRTVFTIGFFIMLPFCRQEFSVVPWHKFDTRAFAILALIVLGGTFCAYLFNIFGIKILGAATIFCSNHSYSFFK